jgi:hypothetical protein
MSKLFLKLLLVPALVVMSISLSPALTVYALGGEVFTNVIL